MKKRSILCSILCFVIMLQLVVSAGAVQMDDASVINGCRTIDGTKPYLNNTLKLENVQAAVLYEISTDTLMYTLNADTQMSPSSLTKIMTALVALENSDLSDLVVVRQEVLDTVPAGAASAKLVADEALTVENLLYSMLVDSANDSSAVLADYVCGSQEAFVVKMNERALQIGCTGTNFVNVHGLHDENHVSTARDIAKILKEAIQNETFAEIFRTIYYVIPATNKSEDRAITTGNYLMSRSNPEIYYDSRVTGGRTGKTNSGLRCVAATAESNGMEMISVVMGAESKLADDNYSEIVIGGFYETSELLDNGFDGMASTQVLLSNQAIKQYPVANGDCDVVVSPNVSISTVLPQNVSSSDLTYRYNDLSPNLTAPIEKGQLISTVEVMYGGACVAQAELYAMNAVAVEESVPLNMQNDGGIPVISVLLLIIAALVVIIIFIFGNRYIRHIRLLSRRKRIRKNHRRSR